MLFFKRFALLSLYIKKSCNKKSISLVLKLVIKRKKSLNKVDSVCEMFFFSFTKYGCLGDFQLRGKEKSN